MSVIAKVSIRAIHDFGSGRLIELGCVCENDLMAAYAGSEEDRLFTRYSPWGEIKLHQPEGWIMGKQGDAFYVMLMRLEEAGNQEFPGTHAFCPARIKSLTDFGDNQAKTVEIINEGKSKNISSFNWKMSVDNPGATNQMLPGRGDYVIAFYPAERFNRDSAIGAAHSH